MSCIYEQKFDCFIIFPLFLIHNSGSLKKSAKRPKEIKGSNENHHWEGEQFVEICSANPIVDGSGYDFIQSAMVETELL